MLLDAVLYAVTAATVVVAVRAIGTVLVVAFVVTPAATARLLTRSIPGAMAAAAGVAAVLGWIGLSASYEASLHHDVRLAAGATVVVAYTSGFAVAGAGPAPARAALAGSNRPVSTVVDSFGQHFFRLALVEAVLVGAVAGAVGVHVLLRRLPFFVVAMSHATFPGVVFGSLLGVSLFAGGAVGRRSPWRCSSSPWASLRQIDDSSAIGIVLAGCFAVGVLVLSAQPGASRDLSAFLVGSIVTVSARRPRHHRRRSGPCSSACWPPSTRSWCSAPSTPAA